MRLMSQLKSSFQLFIRWVEMYTFRAFVAAFLIIISIILVLEPGWMVAAIDSLRIPYAIFLVAFVMFFFLRNNYALASAGAIALLILAPGIWPYFKTAGELPSANKDQVKTEHTDFSVIHYNVKENNKKIETVAQGALKSNADIVSMQELKPTSFAIVDPLMRAVYPYSFSDLSVDGFGLAVYSKYPFAATEVVISNNYPILVGEIIIQNDTLHFVAATTSTPTSDKDFEKQAKQFKFIAEEVNKIQGPLIVMGDMNAAPWSEHIKELLKATKLKDSRKDLSSTYPANSPVQVAIDYIFHSPEIYCESFTTQSGTTSNHLGILGHYQFKDSSKKKSKW